MFSDIKSIHVTENKDTYRTVLSGLTEISSSPTSKDCEEKEITWHELGRGSFKTVYVNAQRTQVYKVPIDHAGPPGLLNKSERLSRLWNIINYDLPSKLYKDGVMMPFVEGEQASDEKTASLLLAIYKTHRRIIPDLCSAGNVLDDGETVRCVDMDMALRSDSPTSVKFLTNQDLLKGETPDKDRYVYGIEYGYESLWQTWAALGNKQTVKMIKALLYLEEHLALNDIKDEYLSMPFIDALADCQSAKIKINVDVVRWLASLLAEGGRLNKDNINTMIIETHVNADVPTCQM